MALRLALGALPSGAAFYVAGARALGDDRQQIRGLVRALQAEHNAAVLVAFLDVAGCVQAEAAGALWELARDGAQDAIREAGAVPKLVALLDLHMPNAVSALWFLARNHAGNRDAIREAGGVPKLVAALRVPVLGKLATGALLSMAYDNQANVAAILAAGAVPELVALLADSATNISPYKAAGVLALLAGMRAGQDAVREAGGIPRLVALLAHPARVARMAAGTLARLAYANRVNQEAIVEAGSVPKLVALLDEGMASRALTTLARNHAANRAHVLEHLADVPAAKVPPEFAPDVAAKARKREYTAVAAGGGLVSHEWLHAHLDLADEANEFVLDPHALPVHVERGVLVTEL